MMENAKREVPKDATHVLKLMGDVDKAAKYLRQTKGFVHFTSQCRQTVQAERDLHKAVRKGRETCHIGMCQQLEMTCCGEGGLVYKLCSAFSDNGCALCYTYAPLPV